MTQDEALKLAKDSAGEHRVPRTGQGGGLQGISQFRHPAAPEAREGLVIGYGSPSDSAWAGTLDALCRVLP